MLPFAYSHPRRLAAYKLIVNTNTPMKCNCCNGTGYRGATGDTCQACEGSGTIEPEAKCYLCGKTLISTRDIRDDVHWECLED